MPMMMPVLMPVAAVKLDGSLDAIVGPLQPPVLLPPPSLLVNAVHARPPHGALESGIAVIAAVCVRHDILLLLFIIFFLLFSLFFFIAAGLALVFVASVVSAHLVFPWRRGERGRQGCEGRMRIMGMQPLLQPLSSFQPPLPLQLCLETSSSLLLPPPSAPFLAPQGL